MSMITDNGGAVLWRGDEPPLRRAIDLMSQRPHLDLNGAYLWLTGRKDKTADVMPLRIDLPLMNWIRFVAIERQNPPGAGFCILCAAFIESYSPDDRAEIMDDAERSLEESNRLADVAAKKRNPNFCDRHVETLKPYMSGTRAPNRPNECSYDYTDKDGRLVFRRKLLLDAYNDTGQFHESPFYALPKTWKRYPWLQHFAPLPKGHPISAGAGFTADSMGTITLDIEQEFSSKCPAFTITPSLYGYISEALEKRKSIRAFASGCAHCLKEFEDWNDGATIVDFLDARATRDTRRMEKDTELDFCPKCRPIADMMWHPPRYVENIAKKTKR